MRTISATVDIEAPPEQVWAVMADLDTCPDWNPFIRSASGQLAEGARLTLRMVPAQGRAFTMRPRVLAAQPGALLRWIGRLVVPGIFDGTRQFALEDLGGQTRLTQSETFRGAQIPFTGKTITQTEDDFRPQPGAQAARRARCPHMTSTARAPARAHRLDRGESRRRRRAGDFLLLPGPTGPQDPAGLAGFAVSGALACALLALRIVA